MKNKIFTCILITLSHTFLFSQINIFIDARVEYKLVEVNVKEKENLKVKKNDGKVIPVEEIISKTGYRIQICFDSDKSVVEKARKKFSNMYPTIGVYINFEPPHYSLKVGDFQKRESALALKDKLFGKFKTTNIILGPVNPPKKSTKIK